MSDDNPHSTNGSSGKSWLDKLKNSISGEPRSKEELVSVITDAEQNEIIDPQTREMIEGVIGVNEMRVRDIMIPRAQMTTIDVEKKVEEFLPLMLESAHSRFPVISEDKDHIEGILLAKDLLPTINKELEDFNLPDLIRDIKVVPESKKADSLLEEFKKDRSHMAIVIDEYGTISGLVIVVTNISPAFTFSSSSVLNIICTFPDPIPGDTARPFNKTSLLDFFSFFSS